MSPARSITIAHLVALNDEIAALARAGMPLEAGLIGVGGDLPGRLGTITTALGRRMEGGASLGEAIEAEGPAIPLTYRAVVEAGLRSGRLAEALEGLAGFGRHYLELRRSISLALLYPVLVLVVGYSLFVLFILELIPRMREAFESLRIPLHGPILALERMGDTIVWWGPIVPTLLLLGILAWWRSGRSSSFQPGQIGIGLRWIPWMKSILEGATAAQFADWLALLTEHGVPWPEALTLSAEATGDARLAASAKAMAEAARRGEPPGSLPQPARGMPPLLDWLLRVGMGQEAIVSALRHAAETYRRRSARQAAILRITLPMLFLLTLGGSVTFVYAMALFAPWTSMLSRISNFR